MNETEWRTHTTDLLRWLHDAVGRGGDFVSEQTPLVIQEYVTYIRTTSTVPVLVGVILAMLVMFLWRVTYRIHKTGTDVEAVQALLLLSVITTFFSAAFIGSSLDECVKAWVAPRVLVLEKVSELSGLGK